MSLSLLRAVPAAVVRTGVQRVFVSRLRKEGKYLQQVVIVSPWITPDNTNAGPLKTLSQIINSRRLPTYVVTRQPQSASHLRATHLLQQCPTVELIYNDNVHAKIYAAVGPPPHGFALIGSANLTAGSSELYEIGLLVVGIGAGCAIVEDLANFGIRHLRTRPESKIIKKANLRSLGNVF